MSKPGTLIAGMAMPGTGKSALFSAVAKLVPTPLCFLEPEESSYGQAVRSRELSGHFTGVHWFRSARVPQLYQARSLADQGHVVFLDSYYDKLCGSYLGKAGMEWLISPTDPYFDNYLQTAELDRERLPEVDALISIQVDESDWKKMLACRERDLDKSLSESFPTQQYYLSAAADYCKISGAKFVPFKNTFGSVEEASSKLLSELKAANVL